MAIWPHFAIPRSRLLLIICWLHYYNEKMKTIPCGVLKSSWKISIDWRTSYSIRSTLALPSLTLNALTNLFSNRAIFLFDTFNPNLCSLYNPRSMNPQWALPADIINIHSCRLRKLRLSKRLNTHSALAPLYLTIISVYMITSYIRALHSVEVAMCPSVTVFRYTAGLLKKNPIERFQASDRTGDDADVQFVSCPDG